MSEPDPDRDLREWFRALREADRARAPRFDRTWVGARGAAAARSGRHPAWRLAWGTLAAAAAVAAVSLLGRWGSHEALSDDDAITVARALGAWRAPTDTLLDAAGTRTFLAAGPDLRLNSVALPEAPAAEAGASNPTTETR